MLDLEYLHIYGSILESLYITLEQWQLSNQVVVENYTNMLDPIGVIVNCWKIDQEYLLWYGINWGWTLLMGVHKCIAAKMISSLGTLYPIWVECQKISWLTSYYQLVDQLLPLYVLGGKLVKSEVLSQHHQQRAYRCISLFWWNSPHNLIS